MSGATRGEIVRVKVRATDFNGRDWDGFPFSDSPSWLEAAWKAKTIIPHTRRCTDYTDWDVTTPHGVVSAEPGDEIEYRNGEMRVFRFVRTEMKP